VKLEHAVGDCVGGGIAAGCADQQSAHLLWLARTRVRDNLLLDLFRDHETPRIHDADAT
jgi:hypothetical protein